MPESSGGETWGPRKLIAPSHGHPFPPSMGSKRQFKGFPGSRPSSLSYLGNFEEEGSSQGRNAMGISLLLGCHLGGSHLGNRHIPLRPLLGRS